MRANKKKNEKLHLTLTGRKVEIDRQKMLFIFNLRSSPFIFINFSFSF